MTAPQFEICYVEPHRIQLEMDGILLTLNALGYDHALMGSLAMKLDDGDETWICEFHLDGSKWTVHEPHVLSFDEEE